MGLLLLPALLGCDSRPGETVTQVNNEQAAAITEIQRLAAKSR